MADTGSSDQLVEALRAAGFGEPGAVAVDQPSALWHFDWATDERPYPDSVVWSHRAGCYDVIVEGWVHHPSWRSAPRAAPSSASRGPTTPRSVRRCSAG